MADRYSQATVSPSLPSTLFTAAELESLEAACGLSFSLEGDNLFFFAEDNFWEAGEDQDNRHVNCTDIFQAKLRQLDSVAYPHIIIEGALTCTEMRPGEFGGFAYVIKRNEVLDWSTSQWLSCRIAK
jgi:hypothetical protein